MTYTRINKFAPEDYRTAQAEYNLTGRRLDQTLYRLCKKHRNHQKRGWVYAKVFIIGRTYATGIERHVPRATGQGSSMSKVGEHIFKNRKKIDGFWKKLRPVRELSPETLKIIANVHEEFVDLLREITAVKSPKKNGEKRESVRAFASKYMHFHFPLVPIIDGNADAALCTLASWKKESKIKMWTDAGLPNSPDPNDEYRGFLVRFFWLYKQAKTKISDLSVARLDAYLIWVENQNDATKAKETGGWGVIDR